MADRTSPGRFTKFLVAWQSVEVAQASESYYGSVDFADPAINATIHIMGGWERFSCYYESHDRLRLQEEFERFYAAFCRDGVPAHLAVPCTGYHARHNRQRFPEFVPKATIIGSLPPIPEKKD